MLPARPLAVHLPFRRTDLAQYPGPGPETLGRALHRRADLAILRFPDPSHFDASDLPGSIARPDEACCATVLRGRQTAAWPGTGPCSTGAVPFGSISLLSADNPRGLVHAFCGCVPGGVRDTDLPKPERALGIRVPGQRIKDGTGIAAREDRCQGAPWISFRERRAPDSW